MGHLCEVFTRLALAQPALHLTLRHNGKHVYEVPGTANLLDRLGLFFGQEVRDRLYPIDAAAGPVRLSGYVADPACERGNAKMQYLFLNGRWIRDRSLGHALQEAYRGLVMTGRYAVAFLFLQMPADLVDVNVHPTKSEVRFREGQGLYSLVLKAVRQRLSAANLTPRLQAPSTLTPPSMPVTTPRNGDSAAAEADFARAFAVPIHQDEPRPLWESTPGVPPAPEFVPAVGEPGASAPGFVPARQDRKAIQLHNAYLVLETPEGMLVVDQHALHERILFEQLKRRIKAGTLEVQQLLVPEPVELTAEQAARTLEHGEALAGLGLGVQDFGGGTVLLTSYPALLGKRRPETILKVVVDHLCSKGRPPTREQLFNDLLSLMACHSAVRSGDPLTPEEIAALIALRDFGDDTHHCPHGRPTSLLFTRHDLDRQFRRV
jgi:DNA mismatch repair protein MutL